LVNASGQPVDIALQLLGGATPYSPAVTNSVPLSVESGASSTRYRVTVVGAGKANGAVTLTQEQIDARKRVVIGQLVQDYVVPLVASITVPVDSATIDGYLDSPQSGGALDQLVADTDRLAPQLFGVADGGDVAGALTLAMDAVAPNPPIQSELLSLVGNLIGSTSGAAAAQAFQNGYSPLYALNVLSAMVLSNDTSVASSNIAASNAADVFVIDVGAAAPSPSPSPGATASPMATTGPSASPTPVGTATPVGSSLNLYVADYGANSFTVTLANASGNAAATRLVSGSNTGIAGNYGIALDASSNVYVSDFSSSGSVHVFAPTANGNATPIRALVGANTGFAGSLGLAIDAAGELLVSNFFGNSIGVFAAGASGNVAPTRTIAGSSTGIAEPYGIALDSANNLYVVNNQSQFGGTDSITVYSAGASGNAAPSRSIQGSNTGMNGAVYDAVDAAGKIYVSNAYAGSVTVYGAGANGNAAPVATIAGPSTLLTRPGGIAVDAAGNIYVGNDGANASTTFVAVFAPGATGNVAPIRTIAGTATGINNPQQLFLGP
jgi:hypothetical protein